MTQRIGHAPRTRSFNRPLDREVEGNDPFIGKERNRRAYQRTGGKQGSAGKAVILGFVDRGGVLRAGTTPIKFAPRPRNSARNPSCWYIELSNCTVSATWKYAARGMEVKVIFCGTWCCA